MSKEDKGTQLDKKDVSAAKKGDNNRFGLIVWLVAPVSLLALGLSGFIYFQLIDMETSSNGIVSSLNQNELKQSELVKSLSLAEQENKKLQVQLATVLQQQADLNDDFRLLASAQGNQKDDWTLAEIEHLLIVSTQRLKLEGNVNMALAAMQAADDRLRDNDDLSLLSIREQLSKDINTLKAVEKVDIAGLALFLSDLVTRAIDLPLKQAKVEEGIRQKSNVAEEKSSKWSKLKTAVWQELKGLVIISRRGEETLATLMPEQHYFLYQNLRLQLESARYAVYDEIRITFRYQLKLFPVG